MSLQDQINRVVALSGQLLNPDSSMRKRAVIALKDILEAAWADYQPHTPDPEIMPAFRINTLPQLAQAIKNETINENLFEMVLLALKIGPGEPSMTEALVHRMIDVSFHKSGEIVGTAILETIYHMGIPARLYAIKESHVMDASIRRRVVAYLTGPVGFREKIHEAVLGLLSESSNPDDWDCLFILSYFFEGEVSRGNLRRALVKVWGKAKGLQREDFAYMLRRIGFAQIGRWWL